MTGPLDSALTAGRDGFTLRTGGDPPQRVRWDEVGRVTAYRVGRTGGDLVCLEVFLPARDLTLAVHQEFAGFDRWMRMLESVLPLEAHWWRKVMHPPAAPGEVVIYQRR